MTTIIRPTKDGTTSMCKSDDAHVGKGRCNHISVDNAVDHVNDSGVKVTKTGFPVCTTRINMERIDLRTTGGNIEHILNDEEVAAATEAIKAMPKNDFVIGE